MCRKKTHFCLKCLLAAQLLGVIFGGYHFWHWQARFEFQEAFESTIRRNTDTIQRRLSALENKMLALRAFYRSSVDVNPREFTTFLESLPLTEFESEQRGSSVKLWLWIAADGGLPEASLIASGEDHASSQIQPTAFHNAVRKFCSNLREDLCTSSERQFLMPASFLGAPLDTAHFHHVALIQPIWHDDAANITRYGRLRGLLIAITDLGEVLHSEPHVPMGYLQGAAMLSAPLTVIASQSTEDTRFDLRTKTVFGTLEKTSVFSLANGSMSVDWSLSAMDDIKVLTPERLLLLLASALVTLVGWWITNGLQALNASLELERDKSRQAVEAKSQFLAKMSHEIRTPLNAIMGMADLIRKDSLTSKQKRYLKELNWSADGLTKLIDDLLDFSRMEARQITLEALPVELQPFFSHISNSLAPKFRAKGVVFYLSLHEDLPRHALLDTHRVRQIVLNLLTNAAKFTSEGRVGLIVRPVEDPDSDGKSWIEISVKDTGIGIPEAVRSRIFERFAQADDSTTRVYGGTGLGLTIVKELVDIMGGHISVSGEFGAGSTFTVTLPLDAVSADQVVPQFAGFERQSEIIAPSESRKSQAVARPLQILVAEDDRVNRLYVKELVRSMGHACTFAHNGLEAVELAAARPFDVILMDCQMPLCDGYEAARRLRAMGPGTFGGDVTILALTANALADERQKCLAAGMNDYLTKPIREPVLAAALLAWRKPNSSAEAAPANVNILPLRSGTSVDVAADEPAQGGLTLVMTGGQTAACDAGATTGLHSEPAGRAVAPASGIDQSRIDELRQSMGDSFSTMLNCFIEDLSTYSAALLGSFASQNYTEARRIAHSLKSTSLLVGALGLSEDAKALEQMLIDLAHDEDSEPIEAKLKMIAATITQVANELQTVPELKAA